MSLVSPYSGSYMRQFGLCIMLAMLIMVIPDISLAQADPNNTNFRIFCRIAGLFTGGAMGSGALGAGIASIGIATLSVSAILGRVSWATAAMVAVGIAVVIGALQIAVIIAGNSTRFSGCPI